MIWFEFDNMHLTVLRNIAYELGHYANYYWQKKAETES